MPKCKKKKAIVSLPVRLLIFKLALLGTTRFTPQVDPPKCVIKFWRQIAG